MSFDVTYCDRCYNPENDGYNQYVDIIAVSDARIRNGNAI